MTEQPKIALTADPVHRDGRNDPVTDVYVVAVDTDPVSGYPENRGIYTDPVAARDHADKIGGWVETWELNNPDGHRTKTVYMLINDAPPPSRPDMHDRPWIEREPRQEQVELSTPDESIAWQKCEGYFRPQDQVIVTAPTIERAQEMMREAMDGYTPEGPTA